MKVPLCLKISDFFIALLTIALAASLFAALPRDSAAKTVRVKTPSAEYLFPLEVDEVYRVAGALGETAIEVSDSKVRVIASPCPNKTCILQGFSHSIVCLPNRVEIYAPAASLSSNAKIDAVAK